MSKRFRSMVPMYYRGASAALLVYDVTEPASFQSIKDWAKGGMPLVLLCHSSTHAEKLIHALTFSLSLSLHTHSLTRLSLSLRLELRANVSEESGGLGKNIVIALVGNKMDLHEERMVTTEAGKAYATEINALFGETSAKQNTGMHSRMGVCLVCLPTFLSLSNSLELSRTLYHSSPTPSFSLSLPPCFFPLGINELFDSLLRKVLRRSQGYITAVPSPQASPSASTSSSSPSEDSCCS
jgi:GTPase SAR1 family protein